MEIITYRFKLDVLKNGVQRILEGFQTGDTYARELEISLVKGSETYDIPLNNVRAYMYITKPSGETDINECEIDNNTIRYLIQTSDLEKGTVKMELRLIGVKGGAPTLILSSPSFELDVWDTVGNENSVPSSTFTALENAIAAADDYRRNTIERVIVTDDGSLEIHKTNGSVYTSTGFSDIYTEMQNIDATAKESAEAAASDALLASQSAAAAKASEDTVIRKVADAEAYIEQNVIDAVAKIETSTTKTEVWAKEAEQTKNEAAALKTDVDDLADLVTDAKAVAETSATEATSARDEALDAANAAATSMTSASNYSNSASASALSASASANAAMEAADLAQQIIRVVTQAEYDALSDAEKNNGAVYVIEDAPGGHEVYIDDDNPGPNSVYSSEKVEERLRGFVPELPDTVLLKGDEDTSVPGKIMAQITDSLGSDIAPKTIIEAVADENGKTLASYLADIKDTDDNQDSAISGINTSIGSINTSIGNINTSLGSINTTLGNKADKSELSSKMDASAGVLKSEVVNNLTTTTTNVPLSAAQGKALNDKIKVTTDGTTSAINKTGTSGLYIREEVSSTDKRQLLATESVIKLESTTNGGSSWTKNWEITPSTLATNTSVANAIKNNISHVYNGPAAKSLANNTWNYNFNSITLTPGSWIVFGLASFAANATGTRKVQISTSSTTAATTSQFGIGSVRAADNGATNVEVIDYYTCTADTPIYLQVHQNSGSALSVTPRLRAIRIAQ